MEAIRDLGLLDLEPIDVKGVKVAPRDVAVAAMGPHLRKPAGRDLVALRVLVEGTKDGKPVTHTFELVDRQDETPRHQRDGAHHGLLALDHRADAGRRERSR